MSGRRRGLWPGLLRCGLRTASVPYDWATRLRNRLYETGLTPSRRAAVPVVSVGNLTLGGTGKTPCVEYVARYYRDGGRRVAILSRGYGSHRGRNDEALLLAENLPDVPHLQGRDRAALAAEAVERFGSEVLVLDDGFQHRRLARDLDVVLVDATDPWGLGYLFPRGLLREARAGLRRADLIVLTRCDQLAMTEWGRLREDVARVAAGVPVVETSHRPLALVNGDRGQAALERLRDRPVAAFCGIGNPAAFRRTLADLGAVPLAFRFYADHHDYSPADMADLCAWAGRLPADAAVVTTQKDLVKLRRPELAGRELWALRVCLHVETGRDVLERMLDEVISSERCMAL